MVGRSHSVLQCARCRKVLWSRWLTRYLDAILRRMHRHAEGVNRRRPECMVSSQCSSPDESRICARHI
jgi:hypothetical protein